MGEPKNAAAREDDLQAFLRVVRRSLLIIVTWIEWRYGLRRSVLSDLEEPRDE